MVLLFCIKKTSSRITWHFLYKQFQCCVLYSSNQCYWPHKYTNEKNVHWYFHMVLSNRSTQCLEAKPALPLKGKYQDSGPDTISLEHSEWMCGITALGRFDTTVVCNPFEVISFFQQWSKHSPQLPTPEVMVFFTLFQWNFAMLFRMRCGKKK